MGDLEAIRPDGQSGKAVDSGGPGLGFPGEAGGLRDDFDSRIRNHRPTRIRYGPVEVGPIDLTENDSSEQGKKHYEKIAAHHGDLPCCLMIASGSEDLLKGKGRVLNSPYSRGKWISVSRSSGFA
jgi:hypothetical protein